MAQNKEGAGQMIVKGEGVVPMVPCTKARPCNVKEEERKRKERGGSVPLGLGKNQRWKRRE
jgi:hypothetical protein